MSEADSLYVRVSLSEPGFAAFRQSPLSRPRNYGDWLPWLATRAYVGEKIGQADIEAMDFLEYASVGDYLDSLVADTFFGRQTARSLHHPSTNRWTLLVMQFSDNYNDFIEALAALRAVAQFKDMPGQDFILIFPYFAAPFDISPNRDVDEKTYLSVGHGTSALAAQTPAEAIQEAESAMKDFYDEVLAELDPSA